MAIVVGLGDRPDGSESERPDLTQTRGSLVFRSSMIVLTSFAGPIITFIHAAQWVCSPQHRGRHVTIYCHAMPGVNPQVSVRWAQLYAAAKWWAAGLTHDTSNGLVDVHHDSIGLVAVF